jgi:hypothetical protein
MGWRRGGERAVGDQEKGTEVDRGDRDEVCEGVSRVEMGRRRLLPMRRCEYKYMRWWTECTYEKRILNAVLPNFLTGEKAV